VTIDLERLPQSVEQLGAAWLDSALHASGALPTNVRVASVDAHPLGAGGGLIGVVAKAQLSYAGDAAGAPRTLIAKFPSPIASNRAVADTYDMYGREVRFYQELSPTTSLPHPRCYFAGRSARSSDFVLLLEDLGDRRIGDQVAGSDLADAEVVIDAMAAFHAESFGRTHEPQYAWVTSHANEGQISGMEAGFAFGWPRFENELAEIIPPRVREWGGSVGARTRDLLTRLCSGPQVIAHADFRLENMFFRARPEHPPFAILDWQSITKSSPGQDLAYYLTQSVKLEVRRAHERRLLERYLAGLRAGGVRDYAWNQLWHDYRLGTLYLLDYAVTIAATLDLANERGAAIARALSQRSCAALDDLACEELLEA
jgi:hypothetical protein